MEQRKVVLSSGAFKQYPTIARVGVIVCSCAVEITTVLQFDSLPQYPWFLYFPTSIANGRLTETAVLHNQRQTTPKVAFFQQQQTVVVGPCVPNQSTLIFTVVVVYVPSYRQSFILHLHMGTQFVPCRTTVSVRSLVSGHTQAQVRGFKGHILGIVGRDAVTVTINEPNNSKLHVYLDGCFGPTQPFWVSDDQKRIWLFAPTCERMPMPKLWVLKPPGRDISVISFYVSEMARPPRFVSPAEPQDLLSIAASIIGQPDDSFFTEGTPCITADSDALLLRSLSRKVHELVAGGLFNAWLNALDWSWRNEITPDAHIDSILAVMGL